MRCRGGGGRRKHREGTGGGPWNERGCDGVKGEVKRGGGEEWKSEWMEKNRRRVAFIVGRMPFNLAKILTHTIHK